MNFSRVASMGVGRIAMRQLCAKAGRDLRIGAGVLYS
jgi:hypothetical protein